MNGREMESECERQAVDVDGKKTNQREKKRKKETESRN